eukprot:TRINITY_DN18741_c0_g1_i1.p1 TRINITY_DN18741_c0_g1~~TRINITY_DN18741_c0_g1_i1.p1  ORF type:complete len:252 (-),score=77.08 TRINITY_DN18741_c0_g1_i1:170-925(-)
MQNLTVGRAAVIAAGSGCAIALVGSRLLGGDGKAQVLPSERARRDTFDGLAKKWDETVRFDEFMTGIGRLRRKLGQRAKGDVLEVAIGSGRNFGYYSSAKVTSVTGVDFSRSMLEAADKKREELLPIQLKLKLATSRKMDFADASFDTVVDTFGICSFEEPVESLQEMRRVMKDDGRMLLLEHGASNWEQVQGFLNGGCHRHVSKYGCFPNRDIVRLVREAGLYVVAEERKHFGTTYFLVCSKHPPVEDAE